MAGEGIIGPNRQSDSECIASMADWSTWKNLDISGVAAAYLESIGGSNYVDFRLLHPGKMIKGFINQSDTDVATVIAITDSGDESTITLQPSQNSGKLPIIRYVKVTGTSDNLTLLCQSR